MAQRLHAALMPDYNGKATAYWWLMLTVGTTCFAAALQSVAQLPMYALWQIAGGVVLAMVTALFPLKIPRTNQVFSVGDVFIVLLLLAHGPEAGCVAAALEALVSSWRSTKRWTTRLGSATIAAVSMWACGHLLHMGIELWALDASERVVMLVMVVMVFGAVYFACNALLMSMVAMLKRSLPFNTAVVLSVFGWVGAASAGASAIAALLFITQRLAGIGVTLTLLPILALLLTTLHFFARQQDADHAARQARAQTLEREAQLATSLARQREAELATQHLRELETSERRFYSAFTHASIGMALVASDGLIHQANPALHSLLGCDDGELHVKGFDELVCASDIHRFQSTLAQVASGASAVQATELRCTRRDGVEVLTSISCSVFSEPGSDGANLILQIQDITARRHAEAELQHRAFHDKLTGLPNRDRFHEALSTAIERSEGGPGRAFAVLFLDFDRFKLINDSKGHGVGDEFLIQASRRLASCLRKGDTLARLGGDEFAILAAGLERDADAVELAERLLEVMREPLRLSAMEISTTASIGITFSSIGYSKPEDMLRDADIAMYRAKLDGKARYALFDVRLHAEVANRVRLEADLRRALSHKGMSIAYQPLYELESGRLRGFEALSRWNHPELGTVSPATFIPIAEESGMIVQITEAVIVSACRQLRLWQLRHGELGDLHVHVNVAAKDVADPAFVGRVKLALEQTGLAPSHLVIELTENILMAQLSAAMGTLTALRELGVGLSVDDFGTGYSSLSHLSTLPIDSLKIDMSFVRHLRPGSKEAAVIRAIVLLGTSLGKEVIAEGIENEVQMELLREMGCSVGQGFYLSRPLPVEAIDLLLQGMQTVPTSAACMTTMAGALYSQGSMVH